MSCYLDLYWATQEDLSLGPLKATEGFQVLFFFFLGGGGRGRDAGIQQYNQKV